MFKPNALGHLTITAKDLQKSLAYFTGVGGFWIAAQEAKSTYLASPLGKLTVVLVEGDKDDCSRVSLEVPYDADLAAMQKSLASQGVVSAFRNHPFPGGEQALCLRDPNGIELELHRGCAFVAPGRGSAGIGPLKVGHVAFYTADIHRTVAFYTAALGFRVSDWIGDHFVFMRCNAEHHAMNFFSGPGTHVHHMAYELRDVGHLNQSCDLLAQAQIPLTWGPLRQGPGHNIAVYHRDAGDLVIEHYCEMDRMMSEELGYFEPRPWHRDQPQRPKTWDPAQQTNAWGFRPPPQHTRSPWGTDRAALTTNERVSGAD